MFIQFTFDNDPSLLPESLAFQLSYETDDITIGINVNQRAFREITERFDALTEQFSAVLAQAMGGNTDLASLLGQAPTSDITPDLLEMFAAAGRMADETSITEDVIKAEAAQGAADAEKHANRRSRRKFTDSTKAEAVARYMSGELVMSICDSYDVFQPTLYRWLREAEVPLRGHRVHSNSVTIGFVGSSLS